ncbi:MAG: smr protein/Muts2-like [Alphaproteobacteria bacterium]|nr:MAG: smr protein/Muts2-like [Alphaproteobacteria bacterium]
MAKRRRELSPAELELWRSVLRDTVPLPGRSLPVLPPEPGVAASLELPAVPLKRPRGRAAATADAPSPVSPPPAPLELGGTAGMDKRQAARLKRGRTAIDARIDLHGMTQAEAHRRLDAFIEASAAAGRRCVLVITGKGLTSEMSGRGSGVLREAVPRWLNEPPLRPRILAVTHAQPQHGGHGALYVLLRRSKG